MDGNFKSILLFRVRGDSNLGSFLKNSPVNALCTSADILNQFLDCIKTVMRNELSSIINQSPFFSLLDDETTDKAEIKQLSIGVQIVRKLPSEKSTNWLNCFFHSNNQVDSKAVSLQIL